jgi:small-conductance mechanosensitive channel
MNEFILENTNRIIISVLLILFLVIWKFALKKSTHRIAKIAEFNIGRTQLMFKYINVLMFIIALFSLLYTWGVDLKDLNLFFSSVFAVIGIALFAIWSVLSNITSGVIMFFSFPFKIGDKIKIHDKEFPIVGIIEDIKAFQMHIRNDDGELITYPNNLILQKPISLLKKEVELLQEENEEDNIY